MGDSDVDLAELSEKAELLAEATGRDKSDVMADLLDDGMLNESNKQTMGILDKANEQAVKAKALLMTVLPIIAILLGGGGAEMLGITDFMGDDSDEDDDDYYDPSWDIVWGCTASDADNYDPYATDDDDSCYWSPEPIYGCTNPAAMNYDSEATDDDGSCEPRHEGCTDPDAENYDDEANEDDGSCEYPPEEPEEPECNGTATFYDVQTEWILENNNTTAKLEMKWDADWSCDEIKYIEVDMVITNESGNISWSKIAAYNITFNEGAYITIYWDTDVSMTDNYTLRLSLWHETESDGWQNPDNKTIALGRPEDEI
jgi:hypothetical protein